MNNRERILAVSGGKPSDRKPLFFYFGPWPQTVERWKEEGLHLNPDAENPLAEAFGLDAGIEGIPVNVGYLPAFKEEVLEERDGRRLIRDARGILQWTRMDGGTVPQFEKCPVESREDWERLKLRLDPDKPGRIPDWFKVWAEKKEKSEAALQLGAYPYGLFGTLRDMIGVESLLLWFYDEPELIREMMEYLTDYWIAVYEKVVPLVRVDVFHIWEDMSGKSGPLISPAMIREFMTPNYRKLRAFCDRHGIPIMGVDTDGDCSRMIEPFMEGGVNLLMPFEVQAGSDVNVFAEEYPELALMGGFDKRALWTGKDAIDAELERLKPMFRPGVRYLPAPDHLIPPEVSLENFTYFVEQLRKML